ncbi:hypothetical protein BC830DRAFT_1154531 [Chytriomyces sp. MP71]|nr:hypothetical protein BC830DRAFT_1154531 [Chytriomyces sp. MP71]
MERNEERSASPPLDFGEERCDSGQEVVAPLTKAYTVLNASTLTAIQFKMDGIGDNQEDLEGEEEEEEDEYEEDSDDIMDPGIPQVRPRQQTGIQIERGRATGVGVGIDQDDLDFKFNAIERGNDVAAAPLVDVSRSLPLAIVRTMSADKTQRIEMLRQQIEKKPILLRLPSPNSVTYAFSASAVTSSADSSLVKHELSTSPTMHPNSLQQQQLIARPAIPAALKLQPHSSPTSSTSATNLSSEFETDTATAADEEEERESLLESSSPETPVADEEWVPGGIPVERPATVSLPIDPSCATSGGRRAGRRLATSPAATGEGTLHNGKPGASHPAPSSYGSGGSGTGGGGGRSRDYQCGECMKWFLRRQDLRRHEVTHSKVKAFACPHGCGTTFGRSDALSRHLKARRCMPGA